MKKQEKLVQMKGTKGSTRIDLPGNFQEEYPYLTIYNMTDNSVCIYPPTVDEPTAGASIICCGVYSVVPIPVFGDMQNGFNVVWTNPRLTNLTKNKTVRLIFSSEPIPAAQSYAPSFNSGGDVINTALVADDVGLATEAKQDDVLTALALQASEVTAAAILAKLEEGILTTLSGRIPEYAWLNAETPPTPTEDFAWGYNFNTTTGAVTTYGWSGVAWVEVV